MAQSFLDKFDEISERVARSQPKDPRPWADIRYEHQIPPIGDWRTWMILGGRGCISAETLIWADGCYRRVDDLCAQGNPVEVLSMSDDGIIAIECDPPFVKGRTRLVTIKLDNGETIRVAPDHRFLTPSGWRDTKRVRVGSFLAVASAHLRSTLDTVQSVRGEDGPRSTRRPQGYRGDCSAYCRQCGEQPLRGLDNARAFAPSQDDVLGHNPPSLRKGGRSSLSGCNHQRLQSGLRARSSFSPVGLCQEGDLCRSGSSSRGPLQPNSQRPRRSRRWTTSEMQVLEVAPREVETWSSSETSWPELPGTCHDREQVLTSASICGENCQNTRMNSPLRGSSSQSGTVRANAIRQGVLPSPCRNDTCWARVVSISESDDEESYYDIHVPGCENYLANGIWNHNSGKSRCGAEMCHEWANKLPGSRGILVGRTADDVRNTMLEGESGLLTMYPEIEYFPSIRRIVWPNGTVAQCYYAETPDTLRGPQCHWFWADEVGTWVDAKKGDIEDTAWNNLMMGCRLGGYEGWEPKGIATLTPKPVKLVIDLVADPSVSMTKASTFDNKSLSQSALDFYTRKYENTRAGRQELYAELLMDAVGALWNTQLLDENRIAKEDMPPLVKIAVGWDPATTSGERSDEHGIIVTGMDAQAHGYVLEDSSGVMTPDKAAMEVVKLYKKWGANMVVYEQNQGGDFVPTVLRNVATGIPCIGVHAKNGKRLRAEPIQALYEQGRVHHVGQFVQLESSMTTWDPDDPKSKSPDRVDAKVYALTWCFEGAGGLARQSFRIGFRRR